MLELLIAAGIAAFPAAECNVALERIDKERLAAGAPIPPDSKLPYDAILSVALRAGP